MRAGLRDHFDWERHGIHLQEIFPNCAVAYAYLQEHPIDLIVTDVVTPFMDGIALAKKVRIEFPDTQIIFTSSHTDAEYLLQAMKNDAFDYVLKSEGFDGLDETISRAVRLMDARQKERQRVDAMEEQLQMLLPLCRDRILHSLLEEPFDQPAACLNLDLDDTASYVCIVIRLSHRWKTVKQRSRAEGQILSRNCDRICAEAIAGKPGSFSFKNRISEFVVLLKLRAADATQDALEVSERIQHDLREQLALGSSAGISKPAKLTELSRAYDEACDAIEQRHYLEEDASGIPEAGGTDQKTVFDLIERQLSEAILSGINARVEETLSQAFAYTRAMTDEERNNFMLFLLLLPSRTLSGLRACRDSSYRNQRQLIEHWLSCPSHIEQEEFLRQIMLESTALLRENSGSAAGAIICQVQAMIRQEYRNQITVADLAERVHLTSTYLCALYKRFTGETIHEALTNERIRQAQRLLCDPEVRLYDVCYRVGYLSPSYFSKIFKRRTGLPPGEYRRKMIGSEEA